MSETYNGTEGTDAANAGLSVLDGGEKWYTGWRAINKTRDMIIAVVATVTRTWTTATTPADARTALGIPPFAPANNSAPGAIPIYSAANQLTTGIPTLPGHAASKTYVDGQIAAIPPSDNTLGNSAYNGFLNSAIYSRTLGTRRSCYVETSGALGYDGSSERFKLHIKPYLAPWHDIVDGLEVKHYERVEDGSHEVGLIAEDLDALGMGWAVLYDDENRPEGIAYEKAWLALIPVVQDLLTRVKELEARDAPAE